MSGTAATPSSTSQQQQPNRLMTTPKGSVRIRDPRSPLSSLSGVIAEPHRQVSSPRRHRETVESPSLATGYVRKRTYRQRAIAAAQRGTGLSGAALPLGGRSRQCVAAPRAPHRSVRGDCLRARPLGQLCPQIARRAADMSSMRVLPAVLVEALRNRRRRATDFPYMLKAAFGRGRLRAGSLRSPCSPANTASASSRSRASPGCARCGQRQHRASREAGSRGAPPESLRGRRAATGLSERQVRAVSCPRARAQIAARPHGSAAAGKRASCQRQRQPDSV